MDFDNENMKPIQLGTIGRPLPVWDKKQNHGGVLMGGRGVITLYTMRNDINRGGASTPANQQDIIGVNDRIYAELMRNYPSRNMTEYLLHELKARDPNRSDWNKNSFVSGYVGGPGVGKSFLFKLIGGLVHPKGCLYLNCKGVDLGSIFSETVFDAKGAEQERAAIDAKIMTGNAGGKGLKEESIEVLKSVLGDALIIEELQDGGRRMEIAWESVKAQGDTVEKQRKHAETLSSALRQVCANEGIALSEGGINIGITTRDGIAIRSLDKNSADYGRPVLLDELNANSDDAGSLEKLFEYVAFLADPKVNSIELTGGQNRKYTFHREELPPTFRLNFTANPNAKGMSRGGFDRALMSRFGTQLDIRTVPDQDETDYADRIAGYLTGAPVMQMYAAGYDTEKNENIYDKTPTLLTEAILYMRKNALTSAEERRLERIGTEEEQNAEISPRILQMANQLGRFFDRLGDLLNPDSSLFTSGTLTISPEYEAYLREIQIDLRLPTKLIEKAAAVEPEPNKDAAPLDVAKAFTGAFNSRAEEDENGFGDLMADRGKRLESFILQWLRQVIVPPDAKTRGIQASECTQILNLALKEAADNGIGSRSFNESGRGGVQRIHTLYDIDRFENPREQAKIVRDVLLQGAKRSFEARGLEMPPAENILGIEEMKHLAKQVKVPANGQVLIADPTPNALATCPFIPAYLVDSSDNRIPEESLPKIEHLASYEGLLVPVAWKEMSATTLRDIWQKAAARTQPIVDDALKMTTEKSDNGLGITSLLVQKLGKPEIVHVLDDGKTTLLVSGRIGDDFKELLKRQGIRHIDYAGANAAQHVNKFVDESTTISTASIERLKEAFLLRNGDPDNWQIDNAKSLGELMTDIKNVPPIAPVYVSTLPVKMPARKKPADLKRSK